MRTCAWNATLRSVRIVFEVLANLHLVLNDAAF
jgi:hypothetical protein